MLDEIGLPAGGNQLEKLPNLRRLPNLLIYFLRPQYGTFVPVDFPFGYPEFSEEVGFRGQLSQQKPLRP
jgi:hypothetical protein